MTLKYQRQHYFFRKNKQTKQKKNPFYKSEINRSENLLEFTLPQAYKDKVAP